jgi:hypothetical protein
MFSFDLWAVNGYEGDLVAIEDPDQTEGEHDEDMPFAQGKRIELSNDFVIEAFALVFFGVDFLSGLQVHCEGLYYIYI